MPHPGGRPSKLTEETKDKLLKSLRTGNYYETACNYAGIGYRTFRAWMLKGETAKSGEYWQFQQVILEAVSQGEVQSVLRIKRAEEEDWKAAAWMLSHRHPERWADTHKVQVEVERELAKCLDLLNEHLPAEVFNKVIDILADAEFREGAAG